MISELSVQNFAIIDRVTLPLGPGFTAITGETGAGKSLLVDAIQLALGDRADSEAVRAGAPKASVAVAFDLSQRRDLRVDLEMLGAEPEEGQLFVHRDVSAEGRSVCRVNGRAINVGTLRNIGQLLIDLHGQHDHQALLRTDGHGPILDQWIGEPVRAALADLAESYAAWQAAERARRQFQTSLRDRAQRIDQLTFQVQDIAQVAPVEGEYEEAESNLQRMRHLERLTQAVQQSLDLLSDGETNAEEQTGQAVRMMEGAERWDDRLVPVRVALETAYVQLQEGIHALREYAETLADPAEIDQLQDRLESLRRLRRKYGASEAEIIAYWREAEAELEQLSSAEASEEALSAEVQARWSLVVASADRLSKLRRPAADQFAQDVTRELHELGLNHARFSVAIQTHEITESGAESIEFQFSANPGEPLRPLARVASGGEMSRLMLAMKTVFAGRVGVPTLIFDEIDAGLGGKAAAVVAKKLVALGQHYQVIAITHSPQIAGQANQQYRIEKVAVDGRVVTQISPLTMAERELEIARMLAGDTVTDEARANARTLLQPAR